MNPLSALSSLFSTAYSKPASRAAATVATPAANPASVTHISTEAQARLAAESGVKSIHEVADSLLLPSASNVETMRQRSEGQMKTALAAHNIPYAPEALSFDQEGKLMLPENYPFKDAFKAMLAQNRELDWSLHTTAALASHLAGLEQAGGLRSGAEAGKGKYDALLPALLQGMPLLHFSSEGALQLWMDGAVLT
ncbi:hypothetical protein [Leeia sp.]|uniref:hypothetical protein n=1 Tax=Leeia sp. TaxID=2884678 RepID=UPI0035AF35CE